MIQSRRLVMPVAAIAILTATLVLPAAPVHAAVQAAPASAADTSVLSSLWQPLAAGLDRLEAGVRGLFAASATGDDSEPDLDPGTEIGRGADPNGFQAPDLGTTSTPTHDPDSGN